MRYSLAMRRSLAVLWVGLVGLSPGCFSNPCSSGACVDGDGGSSDAHPGIDADLVTACSTPGDDEPSIGFITVGPNFSCALDDAGRAWCWGDNRAHQVSPADAPFIATPVVVPPPSGTWIALSAGDEHVCGIFAEDQSQRIGRIACWGSNSSLQRGIMADPPPSLGPVPLDEAPHAFPAFPTDGHFSAIAAGAAFTCAIQKDSPTAGLWCWGENDQGQMGRMSSETPEPPGRTVSTGGTIQALAVGDQHLCATVTEGELLRIQCTGLNAQRQVLPNSTVEQFSLLTDVPLSPAPVLARFPRLAAGRVTSSAFVDGSVWEWGDGIPELTTQVVEQSGTVLSLEHGPDASCIALRDGGDRVLCRERDGATPLLDPAGECTTTFTAACGVALPTAATVGGLGVGLAHACVIANTRVYCWGDARLMNDAPTGSLGPCVEAGGSAGRSAPVRVPFFVP